MNKQKNAFVAFTSVVNDYDLDQMQYDALWDLLSDNSLLPSSNIASKNKALKTKKQNVIGAINELLSTIQSQANTITSFETKLNEAIGDLAGQDNEAWSIIQTIDSNVIRAIVKIWELLGGDMDLGEMGTSIKEALRSLNERINGHEERITRLESIVDAPSVAVTETKITEEPILDEINNKLIHITHVPNNKRIILMVNGIEYDEDDDFTVDREQKTLLWTVTDFDLEPGEDELDVEYYTFAKIL